MQCARCIILHTGHIVADRPGTSVELAWNSAGHQHITSRAPAYNLPGTSSTPAGEQPGTRRVPAGHQPDTSRGTAGYQPGTSRGQSQAPAGDSGHHLSRHAALSASPTRHFSLLPEPDLFSLYSRTTIFLFCFW